MLAWGVGHDVGKPPKEPAVKWGGRCCRERRQHQQSRDLKSEEGWMRPRLLSTRLTRVGRGGGYKEFCQNSICVATSSKHPPHWLSGDQGKSCAHQGPMQMGTATFPRTHDRVKPMLCALPGQGTRTGPALSTLPWTSPSAINAEASCARAPSAMTCFMHMTNRRLQSC